VSVRSILCFGLLLVLGACKENGHNYSAALSYEFADKFIGEYSLSETCERVKGFNNTVSIQKDKIRFGIEKCIIESKNELTVEFDVNIIFSECYIEDVEYTTPASLKKIGPKEVLVKHRDNAPYSIFRCNDEAAELNK